MKRKNLILIIILLLVFSNNSYSQEVVLKFFEILKIDSGVAYGNALSPPTIDSIETIKLDYETEFELLFLDKKDTIYFDNFRILKEDSNFEHIRHIIDTFSYTLDFENSRTITRHDACNGNYETVIEWEEKIPGFSTWTFIDSTKLLDESNWKISNSSFGLKKVKKKVVRTICDPRTFVYPGKSKKIIIAKPIKQNSASENKLYLENTVDYLINKYKLPTMISWRKPKKSLSVIEYRQVEAARIEHVQIYSKKDINKLIPKIKNGLVRKGLIKGIEPLSVSELKEILIIYQHKNSLPIGQFDKKTIDSIIK